MLPKLTKAGCLSCVFVLVFLLHLEESAAQRGDRRRPRYCDFPCLPNPCRKASCPQYPEARCISSRCSGCRAEFYWHGLRVECPRVTTNTSPTTAATTTPTSTTSPNPVAGVCPQVESGTLGICIEDCNNCEARGMLCCSNGCGHQCTRPVIRGKCPAVALGSFGACAEQCTNCETLGMLCCSNGCGHQCMLPVPEVTPTPLPTTSNGKPQCPPRQVQGNVNCPAVDNCSWCEFFGMLCCATFGCSECEYPAGSNPLQTSSSIETFPPPFPEITATPTSTGVSSAPTALLTPSTPTTSSGRRKCPPMKVTPGIVNCPAVDNCVRCEGLGMLCCSTYGCPECEYPEGFDPFHPDSTIGTPPPTTPPITGTCPAVIPNKPCPPVIETCNDCASQGMLCCSNGCGHQCMQPKVGPDFNPPIWSQ